MRNTNKKGFTIVELVIVVAVIAILAAVLIPTFSGIIRKANISSDTVVAKNLNTAAISAGADTFEEAIAAVQEAGYIVANLNAKTNNCYIVWEDASNQFILYDMENSKVIYSNSENYGTINSNWYFAVSESEDVDSIEALGASVCYTPKNQQALLEAFAKLMDKDGEQTVFVVDNMDLTKGGEIFKVTKDTANIVVDLANKTINCAGAVDTTVEFGKADRAFTVNAGKLTVANGKINAGDSYGTVKAQGDVEVFVKNMELVNSLKQGLNLKAIDADSVINVENTTILATLGGGCEAAGGTINLTNVTIEQTGYYDHCSTAIAASGETGVVNVNSGDYSSENTVLFVFSSGGTINVKGGTFTTSSSVLFTVSGNDSSVNSVIKISGGTFTVGDTTKTFEQLDKPWLESVTSGESSIEFVDGSWVIKY